MTDTFDFLVRTRRLFAAAMLVLAASVPATMAHAQQVVVIVNGDPVNALDIEELINDRLKVGEAKKFGLEVTAAEVDAAFATMAGRMRRTPEQFTQALAQSGVNANTLKAKIKADVTWQQLVRGRFQAAFQIAEKDILTAMESKADDTVGYDYTLRPILFLVPPASP